MARQVVVGVSVGLALILVVLAAPSSFVHVGLSLFFTTVICALPALVWLCVIRLTHRLMPPRATLTETRSVRWDQSVAWAISGLTTSSFRQLESLRTDGTFRKEVLSFVSEDGGTFAFVPLNRRRELFFITAVRKGIGDRASLVTANRMLLTSPGPGSFLQLFPGADIDKLFRAHLLAVRALELRGFSRVVTAHITRARLVEDAFAEDNAHELRSSWRAMYSWSPHLGALEGQASFRGVGEDRPGVDAGGLSLSHSEEAQLSFAAPTGALSQPGERAAQRSDSRRGPREALLSPLALCVLWIGFVLSVGRVLSALLLIGIFWRTVFEFVAMLFLFSLPVPLLAAGYGLLRAKGSRRIPAERLVVFAVVAIGLVTVIGAAEQLRGIGLQRVVDDLLPVSAAIEKYHSDRGLRPTSLSSLVPDYLSESPSSSVAGGGRLRYRADPDGFSLCVVDFDHLQTSELCYLPKEVLAPGRWIGNWYYSVDD